MIKFPCTAKSKEDCHGWVSVPKKERCKYNVEEQCTSSVIRVQRMVKEFKAVGISDVLEIVKRLSKDS